MEITTLCYLEKDGKYLMMHRIKKKNDLNEGKWIAPGGHLEIGESPEDCVKREVFEETGITLNSARFRGIVTFYSKPVPEKDKGFSEYMCLFTSDDFDCVPSQGDASFKDCDEGTLEWIEKDDLYKLNLWKGDLIFLDLIKNPEQPFFSLKLVYEGDELKEAVLDDKPIQL